MSGQSSFTRFTWERLLLAAAVGSLVVLVGLVIAQRDVLSLGLAAMILLGLVLLRFRGGLLALGMAILSLVFADIAVYTLTGAISNLINREQLLDLVIPAWLAMTSLAGLTAAIVLGIRRRKPNVGSGNLPLITGSAAVILFILLVGVGLLAGRGEAQPPVVHSGLTLRTENMTFSSTALTADEGQVTIVLSNRDLFWHTFTIDELKVDLKVPVGGERQVTFTAPPGTYTFYCTIPGHHALGMHGTLTVREDGSVSVTLDK
jgi:plastocyanin